MAKKSIGISATAMAAAIVKRFAGRATSESAGRGIMAKNPHKMRTPTAAPSTITKRSNFPRR